MMNKGKKWFKPMFEFDDAITPVVKRNKKENKQFIEDPKSAKVKCTDFQAPNELLKVGHKNWMKNFEPITVEDLAIHNKKVQEVEEWLKSACDRNCSDILLLTGPVGCGKTATLRVVASKHKIKVTEWITPVDIDIPSENGDFEFKERQSTKFLDFILNAANFTSLLDNNSHKLVLVEDYPNTFIRTPSEFTDVLLQYRQRAKSPIVFICSESHTDSKNTAMNLFTPSLKEQLKIHQVTFNSVAATGLRTALKRVADIITKKHKDIYNTPTSDLIECVVNSSAGDVRSAVLNFHFACMKVLGLKQNLDTSVMLDKETKSKTAKKKKSSSKFMSLGKDQTVSILHGIGRVLNPKAVTDNNGRVKFTHSPLEIIEQFLSQPTSFVNFLEENYLPHFSCPYQTEKAASALSDADYMLAEWREKMCQEYGLYVSVAGLMIANKTPVSAWNPVRGPKNMRIQYPSIREMPLLEQNYLYKGKVLVTDYQTYCNIIGGQKL